ncbi:MAG TPA: hypothetical protein VGT02_12770 [Methylomirabilota bacterium]|nr:hypothetical protein [Methylomirabilota bacterium]
MDHLRADDASLRGFAAYAVFTGLGSMVLAFVNRHAARLGAWAWTIMLGWALHLWAIVWLVNIDAVAVRRPSLSVLAIVALGAVFLAVETAAIAALRRRLQRQRD